MPDLESFGSPSMAIVAVALLMAAANGLGGLVVRPATMRRLPEAILLRLIVGINLVGLIGVCLGMVGLLGGMRSVALLVLLGLLGLIDIGHRWSDRSRGGQRRKREVREPANPKRPRSAEAVSRRKTETAGNGQGALRRTARLVPRIALAALALAAVAVILAPALCPPTDWDELVYQEVLPQRWAADGWPAVYLDLPYSGFPSLGPVLFWLMAPLEGVIAPRLLAWVCWMLGLVCLYQVLRRTLAGASALVLIGAFVLNDTLILVTESCYVETIVMMNVAAILLAVRSQRPARRGRPWTGAVILGVLAGGSAAVKLTGFAVVVVPCLWYLGMAWRDRDGRREIAGMLGVVLLTAAFVALPFYLRPWLATGNPFYPYLSEWFTSDPVRIEMSRHHHALGGFGFGVKSVAGFFAGPLLLAFREPNYDGQFGWQLLGLVVLAVAAIASARRPRMRRVVLWPAAVALWFYVFWFFTAQQARFAIPAVLALVVVAGLGLGRTRGRPRRLILAALTLAALASVPWGRSDYHRYSLLAATGEVDRIDYVHNMMRQTYLPLIQAIGVCTPDDARLMLLYEHRGFYVPREYVIGTPLFQEGPFSPPERYGDAARVMDVLREKQISHVVTAKISIGPDHAPGWIDRQQGFLDALNECLRQGLLRVIWESEFYLILQVHEVN